MLLLALRSNILFKTGRNPTEYGLLRLSSLSRFWLPLNSLRKGSLIGKEMPITLDFLIIHFFTAVKKQSSPSTPVDVPNNEWVAHKCLTASQQQQIYLEQSCDPKTPIIWNGFDLQLTMQTE